MDLQPATAMCFLILNQTFHPDLQATAQHAADVARELVCQGHEVIVIAGARAYARPKVVYPARETWQGVKVHRVGALDFGKKTKWQRALNFASFLLAVFWKLLWLPGRGLRPPATSHQPPAAILALTSPPLISVLGAVFAWLKRAELHLWIMDMNPDEAIAAGWLRADAPVTRLLEWLHRFSLRRAAKIVVLDRHMAARVEDKLHRRRGQATLSQSAKRGVDVAACPASPDHGPATMDHGPATTVIPPWSRDNIVRFDAGGRDEFRREHGLAGKFVVMYSGNHSPCHPLDTLLAAAERLRYDPRFAFCFIGGGSRHEEVARFAITRNLSNLTCLPYQSEERLSASLSAADLHAVVMGDPFVGIVHPSKIYNIMRLGIPVLYIGPEESHVTDLATAEAYGRWFFPALHGDVDRVLEHIQAAERCGELASPGQLRVAAQFSHEKLVGRLCAELTGRPRGRTTLS